MKVSSAKRGLLIVFEGLDRVGKSSQVELLQQALQKQGHDVLYQRFPDRTTQTGLVLNDILTNIKSMDIKASHLLFSFNRWEKMDDLYNKIVKEGKTVIVDRYAFSGVAYSIANDAPKEYCLVPDQGLLRPDLVIQLDMSIEDIKKRGGFGLEKYEKEDIQRRVQDNFKMFNKKKYWNVVNANQTKDEVHSDIMKAVEGLIKKYNTCDFIDVNEIKDVEMNSFPKDIKRDLFMLENY